MRWIQTLTLATLPGLLIAQGPLWEWAIPLSGSSEVKCTTVQAIDGGCFVSARSGGSLILPNDTLYNTSAMLFTDATGVPRSWVPMSEPRRSLDIGNGRVGFVSTIEGTFQVGTAVYSSEAGVGLITGSLDTVGTFADVLPMPDLIIGYGDLRVIDVHRAPSGNLFVLGAFSDSVAIADTVLFGSGSFMARFTGTGALIRAEQFDVIPLEQGRAGAIVEGLQGNIHIALVQSISHGPSILGAGLLMITVDPEGTIAGVFDNGNGSFYSDLDPQLAAHPSGGVYLAYSKFSGSDGSPISVTRFSTSGDVIWENTMASPTLSSGGATPFHMETTTDHGVLVSGYTVGPLTMPGAENLEYNPNGIIYQLSEDNELLWAIGDNDGNVFGAQASMNNAGEVYATGWFETAAQFGPHLLPPSSSVSKGYIARIGYGFLGINDGVYEPLHLFPNPTTGSLRISITDPLAKRVQVFDQQGRLVHEVGNTGVQMDMDCSGIQPGLYTVRSGTFVGQVIIE